jgi:hypothetical protein
MRERRFAPRWQFEESLYYRVLEKEKNFSAGFLKDINLLAAKVHLNAPVAVKTKIKLVIKIPNQVTPIFAEGEVIWQNPVAKVFPTGIRFTLFKPADKEKVLNYFKREIRENWWR